MARTRTATTTESADSPEPVSPEAAAEVLTETLKPAEVAPPPSSSRVKCRIKHGQYFVGNGVYLKKGDLVDVSPEEAARLAEVGTAEIVK
jgi:hypothetical protein